MSFSKSKSDYPKRKNSPASDIKKIIKRNNYKFSSDIKKSLVIPINDLDAYEQNPKHNWIYNRLELAKWQKIPAYPLPILPALEEYPVIVKPIINLYGFSLHCFKINSEEELLQPKYNKNTNFWSIFHKSDHTLSTDLFIVNGKIMISNTIKGHLKSKIPGLYDYWEYLPDYPTPSIINKLVKRKFYSYTGVMNVETINNNIIEAHLRLGNIYDLMESNRILKSILSFYVSNPDPKSKPKFKHKRNPRNLAKEKVYLIPVFIPHKEEFILTPKQVKYLSEGAKYYEIDSPNISHPNKYRRVVLLTTLDLKKGLLSRKVILRAHRDSLIYQKYNLDFSAYPITAHPILPPALPVDKLPESPPLPKSSSPS